MSFLLTRTSAVLGVGLGLSLSPLSPFRSAPMQCQYSAPYYRPESQASPDSGWTVDRNDPVLLKQGATKSGWLTASNMRQVSLGSVLGLVVGMGLRAFSRVLVVLLGMGVVFVEVCSWFSLLTGFSYVVGVSWLICFRVCSGLLRRGIM